jgi:hypothetical protein
MSEVPFLELRETYLEIKDELDAAYHRVMNSGWYILGEEVDAFESEFATYCGTKHCVGVGNGLEALQLVLRGYGIGPGDEVIVPANTYIATWLAVSNAGATVVPVEPDGRTYNIDPARIGLPISAIIEFQPRSNDDERAVTAINSNPAVQCCFRVTGPTLLVLIVRVADNVALTKLLAEFTHYGDTKTAVILSTELENRFFFADQPNL